MSISRTRTDKNSGRAHWKALKPGVEWEFENLTIPRDWSKSAVTRLLVQRADAAGWEIDQVRIGQDGYRRVRLRRKIIRQQFDLWLIGA